MNVLVLSQTYCEWNARAKWRRLVDQHASVKITVVTPEMWPSMIVPVHSKPEQYRGKKGSCLWVEPQNVWGAGHEIFHVYRRLSKTIKKCNPDIIVVETGSNSLSLFHVLLLKKLYRLKAKVLFFSWVNWLHPFGWKYRFFYKWIERFNLRNVDGAIIGNPGAESIYRTVRKFKKPIVVIPQIGTDFTTFSRNLSFPSELMFGIPKGSFTIGFAGRLVEEKGVDILLDAFFQVKNDEAFRGREDIMLALVGRGPQYREIDTKIERSPFKESILIIGPLLHSDMPDFFSSIHAFVLPSFDTPCWREQFGQVLVQAMLSNVPVVGSDAGAIPYVIGDGGLVFAQRDSNALAQGLKKLILEKEYREQLQKKGHARAMSCFSDASIAQKTFAFFNDLLREDHASPENHKK